MAETKQRTDWDHTASILALIANANRDPKKRHQPYQPKDFHPFSARNKDETIRMSQADAFATLKAVFVDRRKSKGD
jgi:hypothetical protein